MNYCCESKEGFFIFGFLFCFRFVSAFKDLSDVKWKTRKDTAAKINELIVVDCKMHIQSQGVGDLLALIKTRIQVQWKIVLN